jgi:hypothetical protein
VVTLKLLVPAQQTVYAIPNKASPWKPGERRTLAGVALLLEPSLADPEKAGRLSLSKKSLRVGSHTCENKHDAGA